MKPAIGRLRRIRALVLDVDAGDTIQGSGGTLLRQNGRLEFRVEKD